MFTCGLWRKLPGNSIRFDSAWIGFHFATYCKCNADLTTTIRWSKNETTLHFAEYLESYQRYLCDFFAHIKTSVCWIRLFTPGLVSLFHTVAPSGESDHQRYSFTAGLCSTSQMKMLNEYELNQISSIVGS